MTGLLIFILAFGGIGALIFFYTIGAAFKNHALRAHARERWKKTTGRTVEFGLTGNTPEVLYTYTVEGKEYRSARIAINKPYNSDHRIPLGKRFYTDESGRLRYVPGESVEVYYDPDARKDSALILDFSIPWGGLLFSGLFLAGALVFAFNHFRVIALPEMKAAVFMPPALGLVSILTFALALYHLRLHLRCRDYSSVEGCVLESEIQKTSGKGSSYNLALKYEYEVEGIRYISRQIYATGITIGKNHDQIEEENAAYRKDPKVRVWYDPRAPWSCCLRQGPVFLIVLFLFMAAAFGIAALKVPFR